MYSGYDIFTANPDGSNLKQLTDTPGYDAEATISLDGNKITFTSMRNGDLDIYTMDADGGNVRGNGRGRFAGKFAAKRLNRANDLPQTLHGEPHIVWRYNCQIYSNSIY